MPISFSALCGKLILLANKYRFVISKDPKREKGSKWLLKKTAAAW